jgi:putative hydrolase of the HAD superfamily
MGAAFLHSITVGLLLLDLDNTLVDRAAAFQRWATGYVGGLGRPSTDIDWLVAEDADGYRSREDVGASVAERFGLDASARSAIVDVLRAGLVEEMSLDPAVASALGRARSAGWTLIAVTNGTVNQQERKIRHLGLDGHLDGWVISEGAGVKKPDERIYQMAAELAGLPLFDAWMVGDHPSADVFGAHRLGVNTCWLRRGRVWSETTYAPTIQADDCASAVALVLERA